MKPLNTIKLIKINQIFVALKIRSQKKCVFHCSAIHPSWKGGLICLKYKCWIELRQFSLISLASGYYLIRNFVKAWCCTKILKKEKIVEFCSRGHMKVSNKNSMASSSPSSYWSITSLCLDFVRKHLEGIMRTYEKFYKFPEKNNNFLKKLRLFHFRPNFLLNIFLASTKDPWITKKCWLSRKGQRRRALIFLEMGLSVSGYLVMFSKW